MYYKITEQIQIKESLHFIFFPIYVGVKKNKKIAITSKTNI